MADDTKRPGSTDEIPVNGGPQDGSTAADARNTAGQSEAEAESQQAETASREELNVLATQLDELSAQKADLTERLTRAHADIQNLHKRLEREREETAKYAISKFARDTVAVADNFERAIMSVPQDALADNPVLKSLLDGVTMTEREFLNVLEKHGVVRISPMGEAFDPHQHQAMIEQEDPSVPSGTVLQVYQPGYMIEDRVLRPAMVVVSKGGPKAGRSGAAKADNGDVNTTDQTANGSANGDAGDDS
jgi:molecular chaperone GrpE